MFTPVFAMAFTPSLLRFADEFLSLIEITFCFADNFIFSLEATFIVSLDRKLFPLFGLAKPDKAVGKNKRTNLKENIYKSEEMETAEDTV